MVQIVQTALMAGILPLKGRGVLSKPQWVKTKVAWKLTCTMTHAS